MPRIVQLDGEATEEVEVIRKVSRSYGVLLPDDDGDICVSVTCSFSMEDPEYGEPIDGYELDTDDEIGPQERKDVEDLIRLDLKSAGYAGTGNFRWKDERSDGK